MIFVWIVATGVLGLSLGLYFGRLLTAVLLYWETTRIAAKTTVLVVSFLFGGGGGAAVFEFVSPASGGAFYAGGVAVGMLLAFFAPRMPARYTLETVTNVVRLSESLRAKAPEIDKRSLLIVTLLVPPKLVERDAKIDANQLAEGLEQATDGLAESDDTGPGV